MNRIEVTKIQTLTGHQNPIFAVEKGLDGQQLFTAGNDKGVVEWDLHHYRFNRILLPVRSSVYVLHRLPGSTLMAVGERSGLVTIVDGDSGEIKARLPHHEKPVFAIQAFRHKPEMLVASEDGSVSVWETTSFQLLYHFKVSDQTVRCIALSPDEQTFALGAKDHKISIYQAQDYERIRELDAHHMAITALCYAPDGKYLLSGGRDAQLHVFDSLRDYRVAHAFTAHMFSIYAIVYHPTLPLFATGSRDKSIKIWRADDFSLIKNISFEKGYAIHRLSINNLIWTENHLISVSDDKQVMLWEVTSVT